MAWGQRVGHAGGSQQLWPCPQSILCPAQLCLPPRLRQQRFPPVAWLLSSCLSGQQGSGGFFPQGCLSLREGAGGGPALAGRGGGAAAGAVLGQAEVSGQGAEFGLLGSAVDVDPADGVAFLDVVHVLQEVQVQVEAVGCLQGVGEAAGLLPVPVGFGWLDIC